MSEKRKKEGKGYQGNVWRTLTKYRKTRAGIAGKRKLWRRSESRVTEGGRIDSSR
jgi:hypothetical protein